MKILVFGAGAIGSVMGGFLKKAGDEVVLYGRPWHLDKVHSDGLRITGLFGEHHIPSIPVYTDLSRLASENISFDLILFGVRAYDTESALRQMLPLLKEKTSVLMIQNGVGSLEIAEPMIGRGRILAGRVIFGSRVIEPGLVKVTVIADDVVIGFPFPKEVSRISDEEIKRIAARLSAAGIPTRVSENIHAVLWAKVAYNAALNAMSSMLEAPYGVLMETEETKALMCQIVFETYAVASKKGIRMDPPTPEAYYQLLLSDLIPKTAAHKSSMLQSILKGGRTEIDFLNGAIARFGRELGVPTPINDVLTALIKSKERMMAKQKGPV